MLFKRAAIQIIFLAFMHKLTESESVSFGNLRKEKTAKASDNEVAIKSMNGDNSGDTKAEISFSGDTKVDKSFSGDTKVDKSFSGDTKVDKSFSGDTKVEKSFSGNTKADKSFYSDVVDGDDKLQFNCGYFCISTQQCIQDNGSCNTCDTNTRTCVISPSSQCGQYCSNSFQCQRSQGQCTFCTRNRCTPPQNSQCGNFCSDSFQCQSAEGLCTVCSQNGCVDPRNTQCNNFCSSDLDCRNSLGPCTSCDPTTGRCFEQRVLPCVSTEQLLRTALSSATTSAQVEICQGANINVDSALTVTANNVVLTCQPLQNSRGCATLTSGGSDRVLDVSGSSFHLENIVIKGGKTSANGGGVQITGSGRHRVRYVTFDTNTARKDGGGLYVSGGVCAVDNSMFTGNTASGKGGAAYFNADGTRDNSGNDFSGNYARQCSKFYSPNSGNCGQALIIA